MRYLALVTVTLTLSTAALASSRVFVDASLATGANDGSSWSNAHRGRLGLKQALDAAVVNSDTEIWVANGMYAPADANGPRSATFQLKNGVRILGGFAGGETDVSQRNPKVNVAILTGDLLGDDPAGEIADTYDNAAHVVRSEGNDSTAVIDGVTIKHGNAVPLGSIKPVDREDGAGMLILGGSPTVRSCVFSHNQAGSAGAGIYTEGSSARIEQSEFIENRSYWFGGGVGAALGSSVVISECTFTANISSAGTGVCLGRAFNEPDLGATPHVVDCIFEENIGEIGAAQGGGLAAYNCEPLIERSLFIRNQTNDGGAMLFQDCEATVRNCRLIGNQSNGDVADGMKVNGGHVRLIGCEVLHHAELPGLRSDQTAIHVQGELEIINCTIAHNGGPNGAGGVLVNGGSTVSIVNSILYANESFFGTGMKGQICSFGNVTITVNRSIVQGWDGSLAGSFNSGANPLLRAPLGLDGIRASIDDDVSVLPASPAIDAGDNALAAAGHLTDVRGQSRFIDHPLTPDTGAGASPIVDIGAHEHACASDFNGDGFVTGDDFDAYVVAFEDGDLSADVNHDGFVSGDDFDVYAAAFEEGC